MEFTHHEAAHPASRRRIGADGRTTSIRGKRRLSVWRDRTACDRCAGTEEAEAYRGTAQAHGRGRRTADGYAAHVAHRYTRGVPAGRRPGAGQTKISAAADIGGHHRAQDR